MSAKIMGQVWDLQLPHAEIFVLLAMADHAEHDGSHVFPSQALIAWKTGYSVRQVRRIQDRLKDRKILIQVGQGWRGTNHYRIDLSMAPRKPEPPHQDKMSSEDKMSSHKNTHIHKKLRNSEDKMSAVEDTTTDKMSADKMSSEDIYNTSADIQMSDEPSLEPSVKDTPPTPSLPAKKRGRQKVTPHPIPSDFEPSEKNRQSILAKYPGANVNRLVDAMLDWAQSKGVEKCDWEAELRTFARRDWKERGSPEEPTRSSKKLELSL